MRAPLALLFVAVTARGACIDPIRIPVGPRTVETQCSYSTADIAAEGSLVVGAWVTRMVTGFSRPNTTGKTFGGALDARGRLRAAEQFPMNDMPGTPSLATNGRISLLAWSREGWGTYVQFLDANGARIGEAKKVSEKGHHYVPPRAAWNGRDWLVLLNETPDVAAFRIGTDGSVLERTVVAQNATIGDADGSRIVVKSATGFELIAPGGRHALPIPADAVVALDGELVAWNSGGVGTAGALRLDSREPIRLGGPADGRTVALAGDVVLWSDGVLVRGARISNGVGRPLVAFDGHLYAAADTSEGVVALVSGPCFAAASRLLPRGASVFETPDVVSRAVVSQRVDALVATSRGHHVFWREDRPIVAGARLLATHVEGSAARPPVILSETMSGVDDVAAAAVGAGSAVAWVEYVEEEEPPRSVLKLARFDAGGRLLAPPVQIARTWWFHDMAMTAQGETITIVSSEREDYGYIVDVWKTTVARDGTVTRERLALNVDGWSPGAAVTPDAVVASWYDYAGDRDVLRLTVHDDAAGTRHFPVTGVRMQRLFGGATPLVLWHGAEDVHALFPEWSVDVIAGSPGPYVTLQAAPQPDGSFHVAWAPLFRTPATITIVNVTPTGVVTPREELCFAAEIYEMTMRGGTVDAFLTGSGGAAFVAKRPPPRRRAAGH